MSTPSLRTRIRNVSLLLVVLVIGLGLYALPRVYQLGTSIRDTLYRNYISIEAAQHMHDALRVLQLAERDGHARDALPSSRATFMHWMDIEDHDFTELGEPELAHDIQGRGQRLFDEIAAAPPQARHDSEFDELHARLNDLIAMNQAAMWRADSRAAGLGRRLTYEFAGGLLALLVTGTAFSWALGWALARPLTELAERLRGLSQRHTQVRLGPQPLAELDAVAREFNQMAEQLEQYEKLNVERLLYEKRKTEAIIESLEDGVVLIDSAGIVTHINEIAALIMDIEPADALGSPFDDLSSNSPHYRRVRDALRGLRRAAPDGPRTEVQLHVRGRDHSYVLKPIPLHRTEGTAFGTLLILQDVTYLRDHDRARSNLVETLSHELRTPLTSLALSAQLLQREEATLEPRQRELLRTILEECARMKQLTDSLLNLARGELASISLERERIDLARVAEDVAGRFRLQAEEKHVALERNIAEVPPVSGDPVKLSWVVSNLIGNALRYTPQGGRIEVMTGSADDTVRLEVGDSGPGIAPELRDYVFERFAQYGDGADKGSAGLGLAIVKDIVVAHGGRIFVTGNAPVGSRFVVQLPASREA
ncbi:MAG TPA: ATP-binding protein [Candidatus Binataceae bacterium]|jgi:NtrC-family two-component system sensor histidine kinase KinB|nr:ATP-binding protein [Candidatus Binataceae bacterium]